ncbi:MAG TPA: hypothetical protein VGX21_02365 [Methylomirabilota bacterium]|nr:hypothetical protein [Methylomirabilota bacterium]
MFDMAVRLVEKQLETADRLDAKIGVLWGFLGAGLIWLLGSVAKGDLRLRPAAPLFISGAVLPAALPGYVLAAGLLSVAVGFGCAFHRPSSARL